MDDELLQGTIDYTFKISGKKESYSATIEIDENCNYIEGKSLFKIIANLRTKKASIDFKIKDIIEVSKKYQVLCKFTAFLAVQRLVNPIDLVVSYK